MNDYPLIDSEPFYRPTTAEEEAEIIFAPDATPAQIAEWRSLAEGWQLAFFSFTTAKGRVADWGWVKGAFAVSYTTICYEDGEEFGDVARLTHLPSGRLIGSFAELDDAVFAAEMIASEADWTKDAPALQASARTIHDLLTQKFHLRYRMPTGQKLFIRCARGGS
jgi:hypothetical protein